jgi:hypothetical protein
MPKDDCEQCVNTVYGSSKLRKVGFIQGFSFTSTRASGRRLAGSRTDEKDVRGAEALM